MSDFDGLLSAASGQLPRSDVWVYIYYYTPQFTFLRAAQLTGKLYHGYVLASNIIILQATVGNVMLLKERETTSRIIVHYIGHGIVHGEERWPRIFLESGEALEVHELLKIRWKYPNLTLILDCCNPLSENSKKIRTQQMSVPAIQLLIDWTGFNVISAGSRCYAYYVSLNYTMFYVALELSLAGVYNSVEDLLMAVDLNLRAIYHDYQLQTPAPPSERSAPLPLLIDTTAFDPHMIGNGTTGNI